MISASSHLQPAPIALDARFPLGFVCGTAASVFHFDGATLQGDVACDHVTRRHGLRKRSPEAA